MLNFLKNIFRTNTQNTFIYCSCGNEMCSDGSFISDTQDENNNNHVKYKCKKCGKESDYNFDIAPIPIRLNYKGAETNEISSDILNFKDT